MIFLEDLIEEFEAEEERRVLAMLVGALLLAVIGSNQP